MTTLPIWAQHQKPAKYDPYAIKMAELEAEITRLKEKLDRIHVDSEVVERTKT